MPEGVQVCGSIRTSLVYHAYAANIWGSRAFVVGRTRAADYTPLKHGDVNCSLLPVKLSTRLANQTRYISMSIRGDARGGEHPIAVLLPQVGRTRHTMRLCSRLLVLGDSEGDDGEGVHRVVHVYTAQLKRLALPVPPLPDQAAIARYLDRADRRIRSCIQARERQIELLEDRRQALVNEAVTGRVDVRTGQPYPAYKLSGVEWLGAVPAHWEVRRGKCACFAVLNRR